MDYISLNAAVMISMNRVGLCSLSKALHRAAGWFYQTYQNLHHKRSIKQAALCRTLTRHEQARSYTVEERLVKACYMPPEW